MAFRAPRTEIAAWLDDSRLAFAASNEHPPHRASVAVCGSLRTRAEAYAHSGPPPRPNPEATANRAFDTSNPGSPVRATLKSAHTNVAYFPRRIVSSLRASDRALPGRCTAP